MATIEDTFKLNDMVSPTLKNIERGYNAANMAAYAATQTTTKFQQYITRAQQIYSGMERSAANWNTAQKQAAQETGYTKNAVDDLGSKAEKTGRQIKDSFNNAGNSAKVFRNNILEIDAALNLIERGVNFLKQAVGQAISLSDTMTNTTARLNMMNDGLQTTAELQQKIFWSAQTTGAQYSAVADTVAKLGLQAGQAFGNNNEIIAFSELLNKNFIIAGTSATGIESTMYNLTQALSSGVLRGQDLNSVFSNAPNIVQSIADYMGVSIGQIREMAADGEISANIVKNALFASADEINAKYEQMPTTFSQVFERIKNDALMSFQPISQELNAIANDANFQELTNMISNGIGYASSVVLPFITWVKDVGIPGVVSAIDWVSGKVKWVADIFQTASQWIINNWSKITPILNIIAAALIIVAGAIAVYNAFTLIATAVTFLFTTPILLVVAAILAVILIVKHFVDKFNEATGQTISFLGVIAGGFTALGGALYNIFVVPAWNAIATFVNFLANCFKDPLGSIEILFLEMALHINEILYNLISGIEWLINKIPGVEIDISSGFKNIIDGAKKEIQDKKDAMAWEDVMAYKEAIDLDKVYDFGYNLGEKIESGINNFDPQSLFGGLGNMFGQEDNIPDPEEYKYNNIFDDFNPTGGTLDEVGKIRDDVNITDEDIKLLKDVAQAEFVNKYTTMRPEFTMKIDTINENADMDYAIAAFEEMIVENMASNLST